MHLGTPPPAAEKIVEPPLRAPTIYVPDYVDFTKVQKCLEDRRTNLVTVNSTMFDGNLELEKRPYQRFFVLEKDHFTLFSHFHPPIKFSYKSRNAVMSHLWRDALYANAFGTKFKEVDGLLQLEPLPVLYFVFGQEADTLVSNYVIDDNTIVEYYELTIAIDAAMLAKVAQGKAGLCVSHFFVVNRGKKYRVVDTENPSISYAFGPSIKTRTISRLANRLITVQGLLDEEQAQIGTEAHTIQGSEFMLRDINGEEVVEGDRFLLQVQSGRGDDMDPEEERRTMFDGKDWLHVLNHTNHLGLYEALAHGMVDHGAIFGTAVVDGATYLTFEGQFLQIGGEYCGGSAIALPDAPSKYNRIQISYNSDGDVVLSRWGTGAPIICSWVKYTYGAIYVDDSMEAVHASELLKLRVIKV
ncbi:hypothetical protein IWW37_001940 [Coemansia sp. RSA 2050]|nr:hypothetical protein IWW37_001940 [Coemansia sp. RSA 2050]KAJ2735095.1 hypothetical protein IW152_001825 [Coemansia sp. BCRC 34962]